MGWHKTRKWRLEKGQSQPFYIVVIDTGNEVIYKCDRVYNFMISRDPVYIPLPHRGSPHGHRKRIHPIRIPDPHSIWSCVSSTLYADYAHCLTGSHALSRSTACSSDLDWDRVEENWSLNPDYPSAPDPDPRSRVESPVKCVGLTFFLTVILCHEI